MVRYIPTLGFCWMLLWVSTACAPLHNEPEALSEHRYRVSLHVSDTLIFLGASGLNLPQASEVVVRVPDAQDQPVDGLPVVFSAEPSWTQNVSFAPAEACTRHGEARTTFEANTTGVVHIMAHVDHVMREARMTIQSRPSPVGGGA
jgi:hypothetical protein